jgi:hypothetical protein
LAVSLSSCFNVHRRWVLNPELSSNRSKYSLKSGCFHHTICGQVNRYSGNICLANFTTRLNANSLSYVRPTSIETYLGRLNMFTPYSSCALKYRTALNSSIEPINIIDVANIIPLTPIRCTNKRLAMTFTAKFTAPIIVRILYAP